MNTTASRGLFGFVSFGALSRYPRLGFRVFAIIEVNIAHKINHRYIPSIVNNIVERVELEIMVETTLFSWCIYRILDAYIPISTRVVINLVHTAQIEVSKACIQTLTNIPR